MPGKHLLLREITGEGSFLSSWLHKCYTTAVFTSANKPTSHHTLFKHSIAVIFHYLIMKSHSWTGVSRQFGCLCTCSITDFCLNFHQKNKNICIVALMNSAASYNSAALRQPDTSTGLWTACSGKLQAQTGDAERMQISQRGLRKWTGGLSSANISHRDKKSRLTFIWRKRSVHKKTSRSPRNVSGPSAICLDHRDSCV